MKRHRKVKVHIYYKVKEVNFIRLGIVALSMDNILEKDKMKEIIKLSAVVRGKLEGVKLSCDIL